MTDVHPQVGEMNGRLFTGTSGYSYKQWKGAFYPEKLAQTKFLDYYAEHLSTVEINNTFYRFPSQSMLEGWRQKTPDDFRFAIKANQGITHKGKLADVGQLAIDFVERCTILHEQLGPILFQLPPFLKRDDVLLQNFLAVLPGDAKYSVEFRHNSWFDDAVFSILSEANAALCLSEGDKIDTPKLMTTGFCYIRLRKPAYTKSDLDPWGEWIASQRGAGHDVYCYLKHDDAGKSPKAALELLDMASHGGE